MSEDAHRKPKSDDYLKLLLRHRRKCIKDGVKWEDAYYSDKLTPEDETYLKLYLLTIGHICDKNERPPPRRKTSTAYVGSSENTTSSRVIDHNTQGAKHSEPRTKAGATRWVLCMVLYVPMTLRKRFSSKLLRGYWAAAHGNGKVMRGLCIQRLFGLRSYVVPEMQKFVDAQADKVSRAVDKMVDDKNRLVEHYDFQK